jgi:hypothetical protein
MILNLSLKFENFAFAGLVMLCRFFDTKLSEFEICITTQNVIANITLA